MTNTLCRPNLRCALLGSFQCTDDDFQRLLQLLQYQLDLAPEREVDEDLAGLATEAQHVVDPSTIREGWTDSSVIRTAETTAAPCLGIEPSFRRQR